MRHGSSDGHLLAAEDKLTAPHEADQTYPPHALHPHWIELNILQRESWNSKQHIL